MKIKPFLKQMYYFFAARYKMSHSHRTVCQNPHRHVFATMVQSSLRCDRLVFKIISFNTPVLCGNERVDQHAQAQTMSFDHHHLKPHFMNGSDCDTVVHNH